MTPAAPTVIAAAAWRQRGPWMRQLRLWHWVSAAVSLSGILLFALTGLTLNNPSLFAARPTVTETEVVLPPPVLQALTALPETGASPVPAALSLWAGEVFNLSLTAQQADLSAEELFVALPVPGGDGWLAIDRQSGNVVLRESNAGWVAYLNDLHKGRHAGQVWGWFINFLAVACVIFTLSGLGLLVLQAQLKPMILPLASASLALPVILLLVFVH